MSDLVKVFLSRHVESPQPVNLGGEGGGRGGHGVIQDVVLLLHNHSQVPGHLRASLEKIKYLGSVCMMNYISELRHSWQRAKNELLTELREHLEDLSKKDDDWKLLENLCWTDNKSLQGMAPTECLLSASLHDYLTACFYLPACLLFASLLACLLAYLLACPRTPLDSLECFRNSFRAILSIISRTHTCTHRQTRFPLLELLSELKIAYLG